MHAHFLVEVKWADPISNVRRFEPLPSSLLRRGFCFRLSEAFVMRKQRRFLKFQVVKRRSSSFSKTKGRFDRSPGYIFVGGEECGYFALEKVGSNPTGACIVPWRRSAKIVVTRVRAREFALELCDDDGLARTRPFPDKTNATPVVKKSVTSLIARSRVRIPPRPPRGGVAQWESKRSCESGKSDFASSPVWLASLAVVKRSRSSCRDKMLACLRACRACQLPQGSSFASRPFPANAIAAPVTSIGAAPSLAVVKRRVHR